MKNITHLGDSLGAGVGSLEDCPPPPCWEVGFAWVGVRCEVVFAGAGWFFCVGGLLIKNGVILSFAVQKSSLSLTLGFHDLSQNESPRISFARSIDSHKAKGRQGHTRIAGTWIVPRAAVRSGEREN